jgi:hypothetical protein
LLSASLGALPHDPSGDCIDSGFECSEATQLDSDQPPGHAKLHRTGNHLGLQF